MIVLVITDNHIRLLADQLGKDTAFGLRELPLAASPDAVCDHEPHSQQTYNTSIVVTDWFLMTTILYGLWGMRTEWLSTKKLVSRMIRYVLSGTPTERVHFRSGLFDRGPGYR